MKFLISIMAWLCLTCSCHVRQSSPVVSATISDTIRYAKGFAVQRFDDYTSVDVRDPWDSTRILQRYLLVDRSHPVPEGLPEGIVVKVPVEKIVVYTSVHVSIIDQLQGVDRIIGVCEPRYMDSPFIQEGLRSGQIADLGEATAPNLEKMIDIGAEVVIASPFQNSSYGPVEKLGIPIVEGADYMEATPLGRAEWIRFYGLFLQQESKADSLFRQTESNYLALTELAKGVTQRPTVLSEKRFGSTWHIPAKDSYMAHFFEDAGADYLFSDLPGSGSIPLAFETVLDKAIHSDIWLIKYNQTKDVTYEDLRAEYTAYENFDAFKNQRIYGCNTGRIPLYEEFPMHPDYLLKDLVWVFHPDLFPDYMPRYYTALSTQ